MDENKRSRLLEIGYEIRPCCGLCKWGIFRDSVEWGVCTKLAYTHRKHTDAERQASINRAGVCPNFELSALDAARLDKFQEFLNIPATPSSH